MVSKARSEGVGAAATTSATVRELLDLTDEELLAVDGPDQGVVSLPYLDRIDDEDAREMARSTALRVLFARGLLRFSRAAVDAAGRAPAPGERTVEVAADLADILAIRRAPEGLLAAQRLAGAPSGPEALMRYVHRSGDLVLIEDVSSSGIHRFATAEIEALPELMQTFLQAAPDPTPGAAGEDSSWPPEVVPHRDGAALLAGVHIIAEIVVRLDDTPVSHTHTAYVYPHGAYLGPAPLSDPRAARLARRDPAGLGEWAAALLTGPQRGRRESSA